MKGGGKVDEMDHVSLVPASTLVYKGALFHLVATGKDDEQILIYVWRQRL
jgi:hypothetical protein